MGLVEVVPDYKYTMIVLSWLIEKTPFSFLKTKAAMGLMEFLEFLKTKNSLDN